MGPIVLDSADRGKKWGLSGSETIRKFGPSEKKVKLDAGMSTEPRDLKKKKLE